MDIAILLHKYLPNMVSFGMFARVTDITPKTVEELKNLRHMKLDRINIGIETAHDPTLERMNKGYHCADILEQLSKLDEAGIRYNVFYLKCLLSKWSRRQRIWSRECDCHSSLAEQASSLHHQHSVIDCLS